MAIEAVIHSPEDNEHCQVTHLRNIEGEMRVVSEERTTCLKSGLGGTSSASP